LTFLQAEATLLLSTTLYIKTTKRDIVNQSIPRERGYESRVRTTVIRLFRWTGAWGAATALMAFGPRFIWNKALGFTLLAVGLDIVVGVGVILANKKYLEELDELQRKVQLNSLAITVGVAIVVGIPYSVMASYHVIPFHADVSHLIMLMVLTILVSNLYGTRRYR
jgi:hypothetical protein